MLGGARRLDTQLSRGCVLSRACTTLTRATPDQHFVYGVGAGLHPNKSWAAGGMLRHVAKDRTFARGVPLPPAGVMPARLPPCCWWSSDVLDGLRTPQTKVQRAGHLQ